MGFRGSEVQILSSRPFLPRKRAGYTQAKPALFCVLAAFSLLCSLCVALSLAKIPSALNLLTFFQKRAETSTQLRRGYENYSGPYLRDIKRPPILLWRRGLRYLKRLQAECMRTGAKTWTPNMNADEQNLTRHTSLRH